MCNLYTQTKSVDEVARLFRTLQVPLRFPEGAPNLEPREIAITDPAPIVRAQDGGFDLVVRRWSWPGAHGKPVFNFRSDGRQFGGSSRCLIVADGFFEFTKRANPAQKRKHKWRFTLRTSPIFALAGLWRADSAWGAWSALAFCAGGGGGSFVLRRRR